MMPNKSQTAPAAPAATTPMPKKVYSREFKLQTLELLKTSGKTKVELKRERGLHPVQLRHWERAFNREEGNVQQAFSGSGHQNDADAELRQLRRELDIVRQERDTLKKW